MTAHRYNTQRTCARQIRFELEDGKLHNVQFLGGGCSSNLGAICTLLEGADAEDTARTFRGNTCGKRGTSCVDQLSRAIAAAQEKESDPE